MLYVLALLAAARGAVASSADCELHPPYRILERPLAHCRLRNAVFVPATGEVHVASLNVDDDRPAAAPPPVLAMAYSKVRSAAPCSSPQRPRPAPPRPAPPRPAPPRPNPNHVQAVHHGRGPAPVFGAH